jgi:hypothetical protein
MTAYLTFVRYKKRYIYFALTAMAIHRIPLIFSPKIKFHKTLGCGQGDTFSQQADWQQYGLLAIVEEDYNKSETESPIQELRKKIYGSLITCWWRLFGCELCTLVLQPIEGHGSWDGKKAFGELPLKTDYEGQIAILTRATIHGSKRKRFWEHVEGASNDMRKADGYIFSIGVGETPFLKQATFSIWESKAKMKQFAYGMPHHVDVIQKTRKESWYKEDMFVRFRIERAEGTIRGRQLLQ